MQTKSFCQTSIVLLFIATLLACKKDKQKQSDDYTVITLAGSTDGFADGSGTSAKFNSPKGLATDAQGNVYVADYANSSVRKITPSGIVSTFAGNGLPGYTDDNGTSAQFSYLEGIAADFYGNVYVADPGNGRIRKITSTGIVSTFAQVQGSSGVAVDDLGNVFVTSANNIIFKIDPTGFVSTLAGTGTAGFADGNGTSAQFNRPEGISIDLQGNIYVADRLNYRIRKITPAGIVSTLVVIGSSASFSGPQGITIDTQGNLYVSESGANPNWHLIHKITSAGVESVIAGSTEGYVNGSGSVAHFDVPWGITIDAQGNIYVSEYRGNRIRKISKN